MSDDWMRVADSTQLLNGADGIRFDLPFGKGQRAAFVVRFKGQPHAYLNECRHVPVELDWQPGKFFDDSGAYLVCATHGALYSADDGRCQAGPCSSRGLKKIDCRDQDGAIWVRLETGAG